MANAKIYSSKYTVYLRSQKAPEYGSNVRIHKGYFLGPAILLFDITWDSRLHLPLEIPDSSYKYYATFRNGLGHMELRIPSKIKKQNRRS